jgi:hypothetical protein
LASWYQRQSKLFFDIEKKACEDLSVIAGRAAVDSEHVVVTVDKHLQLCDTYSSLDEVIEGLVADKNIGMLPTCGYHKCVACN